ncbi:hypothetical protein J4E90_004740 [Alternaria incomplexa]|uniref:uncharacterized protein n=1 Tax=Alternaria incomplexa TaxID=1187928 RepID=UPI00222041D0|nr:uncharacterized protein J4E90_004740 [Alternaria incomplexa]XP_051301486.1 uncharacterized protein J4E86_006473 [Alternaria arbusti]KAI4914708.1 hypothetical protein J4E90_004740 [Alternaria incomplexa]KAI4952936.1 hypothetical protein J4E86_006473 [Alternaria arbusti]
MAAAAPESADVTGARKLPTAEELSEALKVDVYDREGKTKTLGELVKGQRTVLVFTRHFWCLNCQAYVRCISESIPPSNLPSNTQILIIGCGSYQPIDTYAANTSSKYPIYTDPSLRLHKLFQFKSNLAEGKAGDEQRDYMRNAGSTMSRIFGGIKGALGNLQHVNSVGPKALNGGEVVLSADGECEYMYRMQNTVDHTNISELAKLIGAEYTPVSSEEGKEQTGNGSAS